MSKKATKVSEEVEKAPASKQKEDVKPNKSVVVEEPAKGGKAAGNRNNKQGRGFF